MQAKVGLLAVVMMLLHCLLSPGAPKPQLPVSVTQKENVTLSRGYR